jgi:2-methylcitrate dehydratase PrpD
LIAGLSFDGLDPTVIDAARKRVFDNTGATAVGLATTEGAGLWRLTDSLSSASAPSVCDIIRLNVATTRATEIDDINIASCTTVGSVVVPLAAAAADEYSFSDRSFLTAVIAGYEAMVRLGTAIDGANSLYKGVWPTYVAAPFAAAAIGARLLELDAQQTASALAMALSRSTAIQGRPAAGLSPRWYVLGCAAADGFVAAHAAAAGIGGDPSVIEAYGKCIGVPVDEDILGEGLGDRWRILDIDTKTFPTSRQGMSSTQAFRQVLTAGRPVEDIEHVRVCVPAQYRSMIGRSQRPQDRLNSLVGVAYQMALAAYEPERLSDALRPVLPWDDRIEAFVARVEVVDDTELTAAFPAQWSGRVEVDWQNAGPSVVEVREPEGAASRPMDWPALQGKLDTILNASGLGDSKAVAALAQDCMNLGIEEIGHIAGGLLRQAAGIAGSQDSSPAGESMFTKEGI